MRPVGRAAPLALVLALGVAPTYAVDITACGEGIRPGEIRLLSSDLVCSSPGGAAIHIDAGGTLEMNGHTIAGPGTAFATGVECEGRRREFCTVNGPGLITNFAIAIAGGGGSLRLQGITARGNGWGLTYKAPRLIELVDVDMSDNLDYGITARGGRIRGRNVTASRNGIGGVWGPVEHLVNVTAIGNGTAGGVLAVHFANRVARLVDSTIVGNDGLGRGYDVLGTVPVKLRNTTCGRGARIRVRRTRGNETTTVRRELPCPGGTTATAPAPVTP